MGILEDWGWDARWTSAFGDDAAKGWFPARLVEEQRGLFQIISENGEKSARTTGAMRHKAEGRAGLPAVGDWIAAEAVPGEKAVMIRRILPRQGVQKTVQWHDAAGKRGPPMPRTQGRDPR